MIGKDTLRDYAGRADVAYGKVRRILNGMSVGDAMYERTSGLFERCRLFSLYLEDGAEIEDTVVVSSRLQALLRSVHLWENKLPEDYQEVLQEVETPVIADVESSKGKGLDKLRAAQMLVREAIVELCSGHPALKYLQEIKKLEELTKSFNALMLDINKLEL